MFDKDKRVLITGSNSGIGLGIAMKFAQLGSKLVLNSFTKSPDDFNLAQKIAREHGVECRYCPANLADPGEARKLIADSGSVDILVNNAGVQFVAPIDEMPIDRWNEIIAVNLSAAFHTSAAALPQMRARGWGRIINICSIHGLSASPFKSAYVAAKHGMIGLTKTIALETAEEPITCNAICPGYVLTPLVENQISDLMKVHNMDHDTVIREVMLARQPSKQFISTEQIADTAAYLCLPGSEQVTGTSIAIDGGWTAL